MKLLVVESPNKIKKIWAELGEGWTVLASAGHVRNLPRKGLGIAKPDFTLLYEFIPSAKVGDRTMPGGEDRVARIAVQARNAEMVYIATDPDREGEAIAWHIKDALGLKDNQYQRVTFNEVTGKAIRAALANPRKIDIDLVHAQEARRALDRFVGYMVAPLLSQKLGLPLTAGRVQSVAVRLVVDLDRRISAFSATKISARRSPSTVEPGRRTGTPRPWSRTHRPMFSTKTLRSARPRRGSFASWMRARTRRARRLRLLSQPRSFCRRRASPSSSTPRLRRGLLKDCSSRARSRTRAQTA